MGKLIRLELFNFKSYKGHHTLLFGDSYFTSIIGPNGSGKSNSMDAISFVLGIKSSQLRSTHLKDLVYRGRVMKTAKINEDGSVAAPETNGHANGYQNGDDESSQRASRGDPKTAWVMAVYEDDAGDEQRWKRSITSQGASEYRINDRVVTSQQYNQALQNESILIKARNFLVFQGDVEAIAAQSPQDLTRLIEQISGSLEYKAEYERLKAEEEQASENSTFMLNRRRGINSEIKQYQEQKREAENFQKKTEERDAAVVTHILWKLYHYQSVMDESSQKIHEHQENLKEFRRSIEAYERQLEAARKEQAVVGREVGKIERAIKEKEKAIEKEENELIPVQEKVKESSGQAGLLEQRLKSMTTERDKFVESVQEAQKQLATVEKAHQKFEDQWRETVKKQGKELSDADRKEYNKLRAHVMEKSSKNQVRLGELTRQLKTDEAIVSSLRARVDNSQSAVERLQSELEAIKKRKETVEEMVRQLSSERDEKKKQFNKAQSERIRINQVKTELEAKLTDCLKRYDEVNDGRRQNDKERRTKEMISSLKRLYPAVRGRVGDLCRPKQKRYDEAVITALGRDFDSIVVDTGKDAEECIHYLKQQTFPPMTFIPLDNVKTNPTNSAVKGKAGVRLTIDTIDYDPAVERAMAYACGSSVVCDTFAIAKDICFREKIGVKAVTLDGQLIHKGGLMTGGRLPEHKGSKKRFEDQDAENLIRLAEKLRDDINKLPRTDHRLQVEEGLQSELSALEQRLHIARDELHSFGKNLASKKRELDAAKKSLTDCEPKYNEAMDNLEASKENLTKFQDAIAQVEDKIFASFCQRLGYSDIRAYEAQQGSLEQQAADERNKFEVQKQRIKAQITWETTRHDNVEARLRETQARLRTLRQDIKQYKEEEVAIQQLLSHLNDELDILNGSIDEVRERHQEKSAKVQEAKAEVQKRSKDIDAQLKAINALETEVQKNSTQKFALLRRCKLEQLQIPLAQGSLDDLPNEDNLLAQDVDAMDVDEEENDGIMEAAMDDYGIEIDFDSLDDELKESDEDHVEEQLERKISDLNSELQKLSPNMRAIERLETVETRLKQTDKEFQDSRAAFKAAQDGFKEIKAKRFELFNKAFTHIQEQIVHVYKDLTRSEAYPLGGQAYLDIEEDTDTPYLSGIKYHAMPPLKRFRDMEHLSGGEKTMAAMALLFAIHSYQPSPFFVLDEIDAALDNANVEKIKKYIRDHAGPGMQFIVISLKPGLFQDSESLVGVYRDQDTNTSRALTLDLRQYQ